MSTQFPSRLIETQTVVMCILRHNANYVPYAQITFLTRKFRNVERNLHCDVLHITTVWVSSLTLDFNDVFAIKAYNKL